MKAQCRQPLVQSSSEQRSGVNGDNDLNTIVQKAKDGLKDRREEADNSMRYEV